MPPTCARAQKGRIVRFVALGLDLTALNVLHRLVHHVRDGTDGAEDAAREAFGGMDG